MAPQEYRGYRISIKIARFDDRIRVETEISLPGDVHDRSRDARLMSDEDPLRLLAAEDILVEALASAKRAVDVLIAERAAIGKSRR